MTLPSQLHDDLHFLRRAVDRKTNHRSPAAILWVVAVYVLICYPLLDFSPRLANWCFGIGGIAMWGVMTLLRRGQIRKEGEIDRQEQRRLKLHWFGGIVLAIAGATALAAAVPALRGPVGGQIIVVMIGLVYFLGGVHFDRQFLWLGPAVMAGGIAVGFVPHYGWTALGIVIALGLVIPTFFKGQAGSADGDVSPGAGAAGAQPI